MHESVFVWQQRDVYRFEFLTEKPPILRQSKLGRACHSGLASPAGTTPLLQTATSSYLFSSTRCIRVFPPLQHLSATGQVEDILDKRVFVSEAAYMP